MALYPCTNNEIDSLITRSITTITSNVSSIGRSAFIWCENLLSAIFPEATTSGNESFRGCTALTYVEIPKCTNIASNMFYGATSLTELDLGSAGSISGSAFNGCSALKTLVLRNSTMCSVNTSAFTNTPFDSTGMGGKIYVPQALISTYQNNSVWSSILALNANNQILAIEGSPYES